MKEKIQPYNEPDSFYSGTDEEYEEFLKSVDGKINTASEVKDENMKEDLGATKVINLQGVINKFRKTAETIKDASKKITSEAASRLEEFAKQPEEEASDVSEKKDLASEEVVIDIEDIKSQISEAVKSSLPDNETAEKSDNSETIFRENDKKLDEIISECQKLGEALKDIEVNCRDGASSAEQAKLKSDVIAGNVEEIQKAVMSVSKLSDSIFDLKNTQMNTKKALENLEETLLGLKKKCVMGITVISILTLISILMSVLVMLS